MVASTSPRATTRIPSTTPKATRRSTSVPTAARGTPRNPPPTRTTCAARSSGSNPRPRAATPFRKAIFSRKARRRRFRRFSRWASAIPGVSTSIRRPAMFMSATSVLMPAATGKSAVRAVSTPSISSAARGITAGPIHAATASTSITISLRRCPARSTTRLSHLTKAPTTPASPSCLRCRLLSSFIPGRIRRNFPSSARAGAPPAAVRSSTTTLVSKRPAVFPNPSTAWSSSTTGSDPSSTGLASMTEGTSRKSCPSPPPPAWPRVMTTAVGDSRSSVLLISSSAKMARSISWTTARPGVRTPIRGSCA